MIVRTRYFTMTYHRLDLIDISVLGLSRYTYTVLFNTSKVGDAISIGVPP
jgi:hypothetical protein